jgi:hypothetical protein
MGFSVMEYCDGGSLAPIRRVDIPVRQANALRKNRAKLPTFLPSLAMVDSKVHRPPGPSGMSLTGNYALLFLSLNFSV